MSPPRSARWTRQHFAPEVQRELASLAGERDLDLYQEALLGLGRRLENQGAWQQAAELYAEVVGTPRASEGSAESGYRARARERLDAILGRGAALPRFEVLGRSLVQQASDPAALVAMAVAGTVFRLTRLAVLSRLSLTAGPQFLTRGFGARLLAGAAGFLAEAPAFTASGRLGNAVLGREQDWSLRAVGREFTGGALTLLGLKLCGGVSGLALRRWGQGPGMSAGLARALLPQAGLFTGIVLSHRLEEGLGLRESHAGATRLTDALATLLQFNIGGRLAHEGLGEAWHAREQALDHQTMGLLALGAESPQALAMPVLAADGPNGGYSDLVFAMMGGAGRSGGRRGGAAGQLSLPFSSPAREPSPRQEVRAELPLDLRLAREARQANAEELSRTLSRLSQPPSSLSRRAQISWLREHRLVSGIPWLGEVSRDGGPEAALALEALQDFATTHRPEVIAELRRNLRHPHLLVVSSALETLHALSATEVLADLQELSRSRGPVSILAEAARVDLGDRTLIPALQERAFTWQSSPLDRILALESLGRLGQVEAAVEELRGFFRYGPKTYFRAGLALVRLRSDAAIPNPAELIHRALPPERAELAQAFWETGRPRQALELWRSVLRSADLRARWEVLAWLRSRRVSGLEPELRELSEDANPETRREALRTRVVLAQARGDGGELETLLEHLDSASIRHSEALQLAAARARLALGESPAARERLEALLQSSFGAHRLQAAEALLERGPHPRAASTLEALLGDPDAELRHRAAGGWARYGLALGAAFSSLLLEPSLVHAAVGAGAGGDGHGLWTSLAPLLLGGILMTVGRSNGGNGASPSDRPSRPPMLGWFENPLQTEEVYPVATPADENPISIGRSTSRVESVFPADLRNISRRHLELRLREGQVEVRVNNRSLGVRINGYNLVPFQWYQLQDRALVEFVSEAGQDIIAQVPDEEIPGESVATPFRLGRQPQEPQDVPAIFRFRLRKTPTPVPPRPRRNMIDRLSGFFGRSRAPTPEAEAEAPPERRSAPPTAFRDSDEVFSEISRLSEEIKTSLHLLEVGRINSQMLLSDEASRRDFLVSLLRIHRRLCGDAETTQTLQIPKSESRRASVEHVRVPAWNGQLFYRLETFRRSLEALRNNQGNSLILEKAHEELGKIQDRLNRSYEVVRPLRRHFQDPRQLMIFDAIESAYRGLRADLPISGYRVRSDTRGLDVMVYREQRQLWREEFYGFERSSRANTNAAVLMGEVTTANGLPVASSLFRALRSGTMYEGNRSVRVSFDLETGMVVGFHDGSPESARALQEQVRQGRRLGEAILQIDAESTGRISSVAILDEAPEKIQSALAELQGLRVLPPQVLVGATGSAGDPDLAFYDIRLQPDADSPAADWHLVAGVVRELRPGWSLLTFEPNVVAGEGLQLWIPSLDASGVFRGDQVTLRRRN
ncbi:MAG: FHA domain-containing protein [bacterium]